jgi:hypothetical protein
MQPILIQEAAALPGIHDCGNSENNCPIQGFHPRREAEKPSARSGTGVIFSIRHRRRKHMLCIRESRNGKRLRAGAVA